MDRSSMEVSENPSGVLPLSSNLVSSTWIDRLALNLLSYSLVLIPIAIIVLSIKHRLCPTFLQNNVLILRFVYGSSSNLRKSENYDPDLGKTLLRTGSLSNKRRISASDTNSPSTINKTLTFLFCFFGLQLSYLIWGLLQEKIMTTKYQVNHSESSSVHESVIPMIRTKNSPLVKEFETISFHDSQFLVFINRVVAFILSIIALVHNRPKKPQLLSGSKYLIRSGEQPSKPSAPLYEYVYCSLSNILSSWCQLEALKYVNFPTQVLSKSCKIVAVMLMSSLMLRKRYNKSDYLFACLLSLGMFIFLMNQPTTSKIAEQARHNSSATIEPELHEDEITSMKEKRLDVTSPMFSGLIILGLYLTFDSFTSNWQQSLFTRYEVTNWQMMAATNFYSIILTLTSLYQLGNLAPAFKLLSRCGPLLLDCALMSIMSSVGQLFVYYTIRRFGSVIFASIMTLRQFFAILLSCAIYGHPLTLGSSGALLLVFLVVGYQMWRKSSSSNFSKTANGKGPNSEPVRIQFRRLSKQ